MRGRDAGAVQVELLESSEFDREQTADDGDPGEAARARRLRWVGFAVVAILVGTIVTATVVDARRDAARRDALAGLGWVLPPLDGPPEEVWRAPGGWIMAMNDDVIVTQGMEGDIRALDAVTGSVLWERGGGSGESCFPVYDYRSGEWSRYPVSETLICAPGHLYAMDGPPEPGVTVSLLAVDAATGSELRTLAVDGALLVQDAVDDDLLLTFLDPGAAIGVIRWDPRAGEVWRYRSAPGVLPESGAIYTSLYGLQDGVLQLTEELALDVGTGREVPVTEADEVAPFYGYVRVLSDGARVEWVWGDEGTGFRPTSVRVLNADGSLRFEVDGVPMFPETTDGSHPDLLMAGRADGALAALDPVSGGELWSVPDMRDTVPALQLGNTLVAVGPTKVTALDIRDGTLLWQVDTRYAANTNVPTDGDVVLVQVVEGGESVLVAVDLRTGTEAWRMPGPGWGYWDLVHVGSRFVLISDSNVIGLG